MLVCGLSLVSPKEICVWQIVSNQRFVNDKLVSGKLSKCLCIYSYTPLITSSALNECLLVLNFQNSCSTECNEHT